MSVCFMTTEQFVYHNGIFSNEASSLGFKAGDKFPPTIMLKSEKTGKYVEFTYHGSEMNSDNELTYHEYISMAQANEGCAPKCIGLLIRIFND